MSDIEDSDEERVLAKEVFSEDEEDEVAPDVGTDVHDDEEEDKNNAIDLWDGAELPDDVNERNLRACMRCGLIKKDNYENLK